MSPSGARGIGSHEAAWTTGHPRPSRLLHLHRHSLIHVLVVGGSIERRVAVAHAFHEGSPLHAGPFLHVDCALQHELVRSALEFWIAGGHGDPGGNPLRASERGTLFLDQVDRLPLETQRLLLAFAEQTTRDLQGGWAGRLIAGSERDLSEAVHSGQFVAALYDCLDKVRIELGKPKPKGEPS